MWRDATGRDITASLDRDREDEPTVCVPAVPSWLHSAQHHGVPARGNAHVRGVRGAAVVDAHRADLHQRVCMSSRFVRCVSVSTHVRFVGEC